jgi:hypothetical protein
MTLGNMRSLGVRSLAVTGELCHHEAVLLAERWPDAVLVRSFRPRMVCTVCGIVGADVRSNWREMKASGGRAHSALKRPNPSSAIMRNQNHG